MDEEKGARPLTECVRNVASEVECFAAFQVSYSTSTISIDQQ